MSQQLDRTIRAYVARGTGLMQNLVRPGNAKGPRPKESYATLLPISDVRTGGPQYRQTVDSDGAPDGTYTEVGRKATYSLQFYRDGALDLANAFDAWCMSENGLIAAATSFASYGGRLRGIRIHAGGSYSTVPAITIADLAGGGSGATAEATLAAGTGSRSIAGIGLTAFGSNYVSPTVTIPAGDEQASAVAYGWGFTVELPLTVRRLDTIMGDAFEERAQIDLAILYTTLDQQDTGGVDTWECEVVDGATGEVLTEEVA